MSAEGMKLSMQRTYINNRSGTHIPTHFIIGCSGDIIKVNELNKIVGATKNSDANLNGIHIEIVGNFNNHNPTEEQYNTLRNKIKDIEYYYSGYKFEIKGHNEFGKTSCPGKNFDYEKLKDKRFLGEYSLSRYYSVVEGQKRYYNGKTFEEDFKMNCHGNCLITANGTNLTNNHKGKSVACPSDIKLGSKLYIEGIGNVVCNDRGLAIKGKMLDMYCGVGDWALDNRRDCPTGKRNVFIYN